MQGISEKGPKRACGWRRNSRGIIRAIFISWTWRKICRGGPPNSKGMSCPRNNSSNSPEPAIPSSRSRPPQLAASCRCGVGIAIGNSNCCSNPNRCAILFSYLSANDSAISKTLPKCRPSARAPISFRKLEKLFGPIPALAVMRGKTDMSLTSPDVWVWHLADIVIALPNVRFWG